MSTVGAMQAAVERLGLPGVIGLGLLVFSAVYIVTTTLPARERAAGLEQLLSSGSKEPVRQEGPEEEIERELGRFYRFFDASNSIVDALTQVNKAVVGSGLQFEAAEYRLARESNLRLSRYEVTLPLRGSYAQVRRFVSALLEDMPQVAIDDVTINRASVSAQEIEARLKLSIYLALP